MLILGVVSSVHLKGKQLLSDFTRGFRVPHKTPKP